MWAPAIGAANIELIIPVYPVIVVPLPDLWTAFCLELILRYAAFLPNQLRGFNISPMVSKMAA